MSDLRGVAAQNLRERAPDSPHVLDELRRSVKDDSRSYDPSTFEITFVGALAQWFSPHPADLAYFDNVIVIGTRTGTGAAFCPHPSSNEPPPNLIGADARAVRSGHICLDVAALDAAYGSIQPVPEPVLQLTAIGTAAQRADARARLIGDELQAMRIESVVMVGAVGSILADLSSRGIAVTAVDMDPAVVGQRLGGVEVQPHTAGPGLLAQASATLVTGMTLTTETLDSILRDARRSSTQVVMFSQTGSNFASRLVSRFRVSSVIAEHFPFYMVPGSTHFGVYRRSNEGQDE